MTTFNRSARRDFTTAELLQLHQLTAEQIRSMGYQPVEFPFPFPRYPGEMVYICGEPISADNVEVGPDCWMCDDLGYIKYKVPVDDPRFGQLFPCPNHCAAAQALEHDRQKRVHAAAHLPDAYGDYTLGSFLALMQASEGVREGKRLAYAAVDAYISAVGNDFYVDFAEIAKKVGRSAVTDWRNSLVLLGERGLGKTGLAASIVHAVVPDGVIVRYVRAMDFLDAVQQRYRENWRDDPPDDDFGDVEAGKIVELVSTVPLLILDEFDVPNLQPDSDKIAKMQDVIRYRHGHHLPTVITTNLLSLGEIEGRWGATTSTVIGQMAHFIPMGGDALRPVPQTLGEVL